MSQERTLHGPSALRRQPENDVAVALDEDGASASARGNHAWYWPLGALSTGPDLGAGAV
jgi:hypothetical protein